MKTLELFNCVVSKPSSKKPFVSEDGYIIEPSALWAKNKIVDFYNKARLSGKDLNKSFYKSFATVISKTRQEIFVDQVLHYWSTYGTNFQGEMHIPEQILNVPDLKLSYKLIKGVSEEEMKQKCLDLLASGVALSDETIDKLLSILVDELGYVFSGDEKIKNREAVIKIADLYGAYPKDTTEFFRYCFYRATGKSLIIKNHAMINAIKESSFNPGPLFEKHGLDKLATIFNRFKPLFLAFKNKCPRVINDISRRSKVFHVPLVQNPLNSVTNKELNESDLHWLDNATPFALFKALQALSCRIGGQNVFNYRIRNGKSFCVSEKSEKSKVVLYRNRLKILDYLQKEYSFSGKKIFIPKGVDYALPTSEKMFVGNVPTGTQFSINNLIVGIYWENSWGSRDIDLSATSLDSKIGWNSRWNSGNIIYSGDVTNAPSGASEYLLIRDYIENPMIVNVNMFTGSDQSKYKIILSYDEKADSIHSKYVIDPNKIILEETVVSPEKASILGFLDKHPKTGMHSVFTLLNFGAGSSRVSTSGGNKLEALYQQYKSPESLNSLLKQLGATIVKTRKEADIDLSISNLDKDSLLRLFTK